jgi:hypothetical protein
MTWVVVVVDFSYSRVEAGYNTFTVALQVVRGVKRGTQFFHNTAINIMWGPQYYCLLYVICDDQSGRAV